MRSHHLLLQALKHSMGRSGLTKGLTTTGNSITLALRHICLLQSLEPKQKAVEGGLWMRRESLVMLLALSLQNLLQLWRKLLPRPLPQGFPRGYPLCLRPGEVQKKHQRCWN